MLSGMSLPLIVAALVDVAIVAALHGYIGRLYSNALTSIEEKNAGFWFYYREAMRRVLAGRPGSGEWLIFVHYLALHLLVPLLGFGLFLRTDGNFIVVILTVFWSVQLVQRVYPGSEPDVETPRESKH